MWQAVTATSQTSFQRDSEGLLEPIFLLVPSENVIELKLYRLKRMLDSSYHHEFDFFYEALGADF